METVADGVHRLGSRWVNFYLVEEGDAVTLVDTGVLGYVDQLGPALTRIGRSPADVKAIVLTHSHTDHTGGANTFVEHTDAPVLAPEAEAAIVTGEAKPVPPKGFLRGLPHRSMMAFVGHMIANKGLAKVRVPNVTPYGPDEIIDVPGKPRAVFTPGHSSGHCGLLFEGRGVYFCGDALATLAVDTGKTGPMLHPFNEDRTRAIEALDAVGEVKANVTLPGHGDPCKGEVAEAVRIARGRL